MLSTVLRPDCGSVPSHGGLGALSDAVIRFESRDYTADAIEEAESYLEQLVASAHRRLVHCDTAFEEATLIKVAVFRELGLCARREPLRRRFTLTNTLLKHGGSCLGLTTVCVAMGEALGLSLRPMLFEGHIAVAHAGSIPPLHIEPTRHGSLLSPEASLILYGGPIGTNRGLLDNSQFLAVHFSNHAAFVDAADGRLEDAASLLDAAVRLYPDYQAAWINKTVVSLALGERRMAEDSLNRLISLTPGPRYQQVADGLAELLNDACFAHGGRELQRLAI